MDEPIIERGWRASRFGLAAALCFSSSSIFIRYGLETLPSPLIGVTIGMVVCALAYGLLLLIRGIFWQDKSASGRWRIPRNILLVQLLAGTLVGLATWVRWLALDDAPIAVVIALGRLSVPVVLILSPFIVGQKFEQVTGRIWLGAMLILLGAMLLTFYG